MAAAVNLLGFMTRVEPAVLTDLHPDNPYRYGVSLRANFNASRSS
jgi:hypothetical protein